MPVFGWILVHVSSAYGSFYVCAAVCACEHVCENNLDDSENVHTR